MFWKLYGCVGRYQSLVTHTHTPIDSSIILYQKCAKCIRSLSFFISLFRQYKGKKRKEKLTWKTTQQKLVPVIWLIFDYENVYNLIKKIVSYFSLSLYSFLCVKSGNTIHIVYHLLALFLYPFCPQDSIFLWYILSSNKTNVLRDTQFAPNPSAYRPHGIERRNEEKWIVDIDAAYLLLHNQKFIHLHRLVWSGPVRFSWMVKNVSQSGRDKKEEAPQNVK